MALKNSHNSNTYRKISQNFDLPGCRRKDDDDDNDDDDDDDDDDNNNNNNLFEIVLIPSLHGGSEMEE